MVVQKQYNLRQWNNAMTDCISLIELARFLNKTIYKLQYFVEKPQNKSFFFAATPLFSCLILSLPLLSADDCVQYSMLFYESMSLATCQKSSSFKKMHKQWIQDSSESPRET